MNKLKDPFIFKPLLAGLLLGISRLPLGLGFLVFFAFIPLISLLKQISSYKQIIKPAIILSLAYTAVCLHWISLVTAPGLVGIFILVAAYFFILLAVICFVSKNFPILFYPALISVWVAFEYLQNFGEFSFPWFNLAYSLADYNVFIQPAEIGGVYLLSGLVLLVNIFLFRMAKHYRSSLVCLLVLFLVWAGLGIYRLQTIKLEEHPLKAAIVQVSIPQKQKWQSFYEKKTLELYSEYTNLAAKQDPALIIWPESAIPGYVLHNYKYRMFVKRLARKYKTNIFLGFPDYRRAATEHPSDYKHYNSGSQIDRTGRFSPPYDKNILVPFGERIPLLEVFPILWNLHLGQANWEYGDSPKYFQVHDLKYSPLICFEIAFPILTKRIARDNPDFLVNITNDAWFYRSAGTYQHAVMAKFRAVETRLQIFRAANTGYSLVVSPTGEIMKKSELFKKTVLTNNILTYAGKTIFTKYLGWFPLVFVFSVAVFLLISVVRKFLGIL